jgi:hypothetical protein
MAAELADIAATLAAWQAQGAAQLDPVGWLRIQALHARAERASGALARDLKARLDAQVQGFGQRLQARGAAGPVSRTGLDALSDLVAALASRQRDARPPAAGADDLAPAKPSLPALDALADSRRTWTRLHTQSQLRRSLEQLPADAGPLNSAVLAHRALSLMQEAGNGYAEHFVSYVDTLASLELLAALRPPRAAESSPGAARPGKAPRKPRRRKGDAG